MKFFPKTKYFFNLVLPIVLLFQWTLPTIETKRNPQTNFGELLLVKCNDPEHSHPPLSERKPANEPVKFVNLEASNLFFVSTPPKFLNVSGEDKFKKIITLPELSLTPFPPARGPPYFEV